MTTAADVALGTAAQEMTAGQRRVPDRLGLLRFATWPTHRGDGGCPLLP